MPWKPSDAKKHTKKANTPNKARKWATRANNVKSRCEARNGKDCDAMAIRVANAYIARMK